MKRDASKSWLEWVRQSALGHVLFLEVIGALPISTIYIVLFYMDGTLTFGWAIYTFFATIGCLALAALMYWFVLTRPRLRKRH
jgi:hypothetical protein